MTPRRTSDTKDFMTAAWKHWAKQVSKKELLLKRKKLGRKRNMQAIVDGSSEPSRKKLLLAKEEEVKELQAQLEAVKEELREERKRNFELQETVIKGMGKVQLQLAALQGSIRFTASTDSLEDAQVQEPICHLEEVASRPSTVASRGGSFNPEATRHHTDAAAPLSAVIGSPSERSLNPVPPCHRTEAAAPGPVGFRSPSCSPGPSRHRTEAAAPGSAAIRSPSCSLGPSRHHTEAAAPSPVAIGSPTGPSRHRTEAAAPGSAAIRSPSCSLGPSRHHTEAAAPSPVAIGSPTGPSRHRTEQDALWMAASSSLTGCHSSGLPGHHSDEEAWDSERSGGDEPIGKDEVGLGQGIVIPRDKWERLLEEPKDSIFVRETAKVVWGTKNLYNRSVTGAPCRRYLHKEKEGGVAAPKKRALTPRKLQVLHAAFECHIQAHESAVDPQVRRRAVNRYLADMLKTLVKKEDACVVLHEK
ncbi:uncharacterized protein LOC144172903 [Haemaphysalis longicornis]